MDVFQCWMKCTVLLLRKRMAFYPKLFDNQILVCNLYKQKTRLASGNFCLFSMLVGTFKKKCHWLHLVVLMFAAFCLRTFCEMKQVIRNHKDISEWHRSSENYLFSLKQCLADDWRADTGTVEARCRFEAALHFWKPSVLAKMKCLLSCLAESRQHLMVPP